MEDPTNVASKVMHLRFTRLVFGLRSSPAVLGAVIFHHLESYKDKYPNLVQLMENCLYVDDLVTGTDTIEQGFELYQKAKQIMKDAGLNLRKWNSNSQELLERIRKAEDTTKSTNSVNNLQLKVSEEEESYSKSTINTITNVKFSKLLGVIWDSYSDKLLFDFSNITEYANSLPSSKRSVLKVTAKLFDPLGLLSPFIIRLKIMFRTLCLGKLDWDDVLPDNLLGEWKSIIAELGTLSNLHVDRCYFYTEPSHVNFQLHGFCDASLQAYAAVVYLRTVYADGSVTVRIIASKTRVSPVKSQTIPRLELLAAVILTRLAIVVRESLLMLGDMELHFWTDSNVVLSWISSNRSYKQYVTSRIKEIHQNTNREDWHHCPGVLNPADMPSRGLKGSELPNRKTWWEGPQFLQLDKAEWPSTIITEFTEETDSELLKTQPDIAHVFTSSQNCSPISLSKIVEAKNFSNWETLLRVTAYILRFIHRCKKNTCNDSSVINQILLTAKEINLAERYWIRSIQLEEFPAEITYLQSRQAAKPIRIDQFGLYLDDFKILRCRGRVNNSSLCLGAKNPILLPYNHHYVHLLILHVHRKLKHSGIGDTLASIREQYWVLKGRQAVKQIIRKCVTCKRMDGVAYPVVKPPDLPTTRVSDDPPFSHTGVDFAGPLYVHSPDETTGSMKTYICLFTCASTRAVHLELVADLNVSSFLLAFRRFTSRRGLPTTLLSDNAKTFKSAAKEVHNIIRSKDVHTHLTNLRITWNFIVERAPWWGGFWERMVQTVKKCLRKAIGQATLTFDQLQTLLIEIEAIVNSRPLTYAYDDVEGLSYTISPSHLLYGRRIASVPNNEIYEVVSTHESLIRRCKQQKHIFQQFMSLWRKTYLLHLREHHRVKQRVTKGPEVAVGDVVILKNDTTKRLFWKLAIVKELLTGIDGNVRAAIVMTTDPNYKSKQLRRSIRHLIPIEVKAEESNNSHQEKHDPVVTETRQRRAAAVTGELKRKLQGN